MTDQPNALTTSEALEYIRVHTGRDKPHCRDQLARWIRSGKLKPHTIGGGTGKQNTFTIEALDLFVLRHNSNYWRKAGQQTRRHGASP